MAQKLTGESVDALPGWVPKPLAERIEALARKRGLQWPPNLRAIVRPDACGSGGPVDTALDAPTVALPDHELENQLVYHGGGDVSTYVFGDDIVGDTEGCASGLTLVRSNCNRNS